MQKVSVFWFRRDLRLVDNLGLLKALEAENPVLPIFIFDENILNELPKNDARVSFIYEQTQQIRNKLQTEFDSSLAIYFGNPREVFENSILKDFEVKAVYTNTDYEPYAIKRDAAIEALLAKNGIDFYSFKDQVVFEKDEILKDDGEPYLVFTPYMKKWKSVFKTTTYSFENSYNKLKNTYKNKRLPNLSLADIGFKQSTIKIPAYQLGEDFIENYSKTRNIPAIDGTSKLSPHLRFGTLSYQKIISKASTAKDETFLNELIWREFFKMILFHFPASIQRSFKPKYDKIDWRNNESEFEKWKAGKTGYPIVDAGMRQLNETGWMHNRVRMIVGSFLCKHLLIDWRWGEAYFAEKLLDYDLSSNIGGWQWVAGTGVDAAPYFRIFNPYTQTEKFDKNAAYIKKWVQEFEDETYPNPIVDHKFARERCLETYKIALQ
ncbi:MAG: cryptochrome/photolyase family protein [Bacteroidota bacterium]